MLHIFHQEISATLFFLIFFSGVFFISIMKFTFQLMLISFKTLKTNFFSIHVTYIFHKKILKAEENLRNSNLKNT